MRFLHLAVISVLLFLTGCNAAADHVSAEEISSPTPFQPLTNSASDTPASDSAPTPVDLPTLAPLLPTPTPFLILPQYIPADAMVPAFTVTSTLNPLTGLPPVDPALLQRRPMAIKVANYPRYMRPQSGLTLADQVFEYYIEDGLTRFIAVFYGNDSEWVGPVRSGRYFDEHVQRMYHAFLVFKFADPRELGYFQGSEFADLLLTPTNGSCPPFHFLTEREQTVEPYNNSYFNTTLMADCASRGGKDNSPQIIRDGLFDAAPPLAGLGGIKVSTFYSVDSYHYWLYSPQDQQYYRYQETADVRDGKEGSFAPLVDRVTSQHVHAANVVVMLAYHSFANEYDEDDEVFKIDMTGSGEAYVFRDGVGIPAKWYRTNLDQPLYFATLDGAPIYLRPGITFYEVIGSRSFVDQASGEWNFRHDPP
ncbi:MAG: DUF3048 domain-containing protein [Anaerolineae bacterium]|jgi:hypothetical protein|nr:DUF3048 domain-containing protein [Anaerolineae bacterium]MBL8106218.1 DUF3048 domain-containing protein [Anaerolineales bacterium]MCC7187451.1 DUF3048 domain-containing protein [Anaerolineales bacterium]